MKLSVIIPTYQTPDIVPLLNALSKQTMPAHEIIVVENGNECPTLDPQLKDCGLSSVIKYIHEEKPGLNRARNIGIRASKGSHLSLLDDDCIPTNNWVEAVMNAHRENPAAGVIGGRVLLNYTEEAPVWLNSEFRRSLAELNYGEGQKNLGRWQHLVGANLSFSRNVFDELGGFQESLGLIGGDSIIRANDEAEFIQKACLRGLPGAIYEGRAVVHHCIPPSRLTLDYIFRRRYGQGVSDIEHDLLFSGIQKAQRTFYNQVFHAGWHLAELEGDAGSLSDTDANSMLWRSMVARVIYLMGARERLMSKLPEFSIFQPLNPHEESAFYRGKNIAITSIGDDDKLLVLVLKRVLYDTRTTYSPFTRVSMLIGIISHKLDIQVKPNVLKGMA